MRHRKQGRKLGRTLSHRHAMFANMASSLIIHDRIETTLPKAKEIRRLAERIVTLGKRGTVPARRRAIALIRDKKAVSRAFDELAKRFADRKGGYTRIMKLGCRRGDAAPMAIIEYIRGEHEAPVHAEKKGKAKKEKAPAKKAAPKTEEKKAQKKARKPAAKKAKAEKTDKKKGQAKKHTGRKVMKRKAEG